MLRDSTQDSADTSVIYHQLADPRLSLLRIRDNKLACKSLINSCKMGSSAARHRISSNVPNVLLEPGQPSRGHIVLVLTGANILATRGLFFENSFFFLFFFFALAVYHNS